MNNQKSGIATLEETLNMYDLEYSMTGKHYPMNITSMEILNRPLTTTTWDCDDFKMLSDALVICIEELDMTKKELRQFIEEFDMSPCEVSGEYVKESYRNSHAGLVDLLKNALKGISYAQDKFTSVFDARATHEFKSTESAFIYKGYYITPCILRDIIELAWKDCKKEYQKEFINKFYNGNKTDFKTIANDCLADMFNNDNVERLSLINDYKVLSVGV